jgi:hypothetical protein
MPSHHRLGRKSAGLGDQELLGHRLGTERLRPRKYEANLIGRNHEVVAQDTLSKAISLREASPRLRSAVPSSGAPGRINPIGQLAKRDMPWLSVLPGASARPSPRRL